MISKSLLDNSHNDTSERPSGWNNENTTDMLGDSSNNDTLLRTTFIGPKNGT